MYKIAKNRESGNFELVRNRDGRIMGKTPIMGASTAVLIARHMAGLKPHISGLLWRAASLVATGKARYLPEGERPHRHGYESFVTQVAEVNGYAVEQVQQEAAAVAAPMPKPTYSCECDFYTKGRGKRPIVAGMPVCKHILAALIERQVVTNLEHWREVLGLDRVRRDLVTAYSDGRFLENLRIRKEQEAARDWRGDLIVSHVRAKARREKANRIQRDAEAGGYTPAISNQEQPF